MLPCFPLLQSSIQLVVGAPWKPCILHYRSFAAAQMLIALSARHCTPTQHSCAACIWQHTPRQLLLWLPSGLEEEVSCVEHRVLCRYMRELPYGFETLLENLVDPSHVPFTHSGVIGDRTSAAISRMTINQKATLNGGFAMNLREVQPGASDLVEKGGKNTDSTLHFVPPTLTRYGSCASGVAKQGRHEPELLAKGPVELHCLCASCTTCLQHMCTTKPCDTSDHAGFPD